MADVELTDDDERFRRDVAAWLADHVVGEYAELKGRGGPGDEDVGFDVRVAWEHELGKAGFIGLGWPVEAGGRGASLDQQIIWAEEYARAEAPARVNHMGENLLAPTLIAYGTPEQQERFLPGILRGDERWCQGYSEPNAGSDLANVATRAVARRRRVGRQRSEGVDVARARVALVLRRRPHRSRRRRGTRACRSCSCRWTSPASRCGPIVQPTGGGEFNEVFFDDARTEASLVVGEVDDGWRIAMGLLGFERGVSTLAQQVGFRARARPRARPRRARGRGDDPGLRTRLVDAWIGLRLMKWNAMRSMAAKGVPGPEASISKLFWGTWHRDLGNLTIDVLGAEGLIGEIVCRTSSRSNRSCSCSAAPTRSTAARTRSSATCWASACWDCPATRAEVRVQTACVILPGGG